MDDMNLGGYVYGRPKAHTKDEDCAPFLRDGACSVCGVGHGEPTQCCGATGFHKAGCPQS